MSPVTLAIVFGVLGAVLAHLGVFMLARLGLFARAPKCAATDVPPLRPSTIQPAASRTCRARHRAHRRARLDITAAVARDRNRGS